MFSSRERLQKKTPANGIDRKEFINHLVDEYYETTSVGMFSFLVMNLDFILFEDYFNYSVLFQRLRSK